MRILISGLKGFMGNEVARLAAKGYRGAELVYGVDPAEGPAPVPCYPSFAEAPADVDVVVDFSHHSCTQELLDYAVKNGLRLVLATTGQTEEEREAATQKLIDIDVQFHAALYEMTGNKSLMDFHQILRHLFTVYFHKVEKDFHDRTTISHIDLYNLLRSGTADTFRMAMQLHLRPQLVNMESALDKTIVK